MSLQRYAYFILALFLGYSWVYFSAWKSLEAGSNERIALREIQQKVSSLEKDNFRLLYQVDDLAQALAVKNQGVQKSDRSIASVDMSPLSDQRSEAIHRLFQQQNYMQVLAEIKKFENDFPLSNRRCPLWILKAKSLLKKSKTEESVSVLETILEVYPDQPQAAEALELLSDISVTFEKKSDALAYLKIIEKQFPDYYKNQEINEKVIALTKGQKNNE